MTDQLNVMGTHLCIWKSYLCLKFVNFVNGFRLEKLGNFVSGFRLELMYISFIVSMRSNFAHPHGFQQLVLLYANFFFFAFTNRINLLNLKKSSGRLIIIARGFFKLPELHMPLKQRSSSLPRNLALRTFDKLLIVLLTKVNLLYFLYSTD